MSKKRIVLTDESVNRYGYRVLTSGCNLEDFKKNPIMLYMHFRDEGSPMWGDSKAIGHWEDLTIEDGVLYGTPVFDQVDDLSKTIAAKFEAGTYNAASIGFRILATSSEKEYLVPGQTRETVTRWDLLEASIVDVPANRNAVRLYHTESLSLLAASEMANVVPELIQKTNVNQNRMKISKAWTGILAILGMKPENGDGQELTVDNLTSLNDGIAGLNSNINTLTAERDQIKTKLEKADQENKDLTTERDNLKTQLTDRDAQIAQLKKDLADRDAQIAELKKKPNPDKSLSPENDNDNGESLLDYCNQNSDNYQAVSERLKEEGLI